MIDQQDDDRPWVHMEPDAQKRLRRLFELVDELDLEDEKPYVDVSIEGADVRVGCYQRFKITVRKLIILLLLLSLLVAWIIQNPAMLEILGNLWSLIFLVS